MMPETDLISCNACFSLPPEFSVRTGEYLKVGPYSLPDSRTPRGPREVRLQRRGARSILGVVHEVPEHRGLQLHLSRGVSWYNYF